MACKTIFTHIVSNVRTIRNAIDIRKIAGSLASLFLERNSVTSNAADSLVRDDWACNVVTTE